jgi:hypothetical protein
MISILAAVDLRKIGTFAVSAYTRDAAQSRIKQILSFSFLLQELIYSIHQQHHKCNNKASFEKIEKIIIFMFSPSRFHLTEFSKIRNYNNVSIYFCINTPVRGNRNKMHVVIFNLSFHTS